MAHIFGDRHLMAGLDLFFVLSGFLIGRIYFRSRRKQDFNVWSFWLSRWWRTIPPYYIALLIFALSSLVRMNEPVSWKYLFFLQNLTGWQGFGVSWSLCVEEHFYLLLPILALLSQKLFGRRSVIWLIPILFCIPSALTVVLAGGLRQPIPEPWLFANTTPILNMTPFASEGLMAGVWLAYLFIEEPKLFHESRKIALWLMWLPAIFIFAPWPDTAWFVASKPAVQAVGLVSLLRVVYDVQWKPLTAAGRAAASSIRFIATISYSVYLVHLLLNTMVRHYLLGWPRGQFVFIKFIVVATAYLLPCLPFYYLFERPAIISRDRYMKRKAALQALQLDAHGGITQQANS